MSRITAWLRAAILIAPAAILAACSPQGDRDEAAELMLDPSSALQGASLVVRISAPDVRFDRCGQLTDSATAVEAVVFDSPDVEQIEVYVVQVLSPQVLRVEIAVEPDAEVGQHTVEVACGSGPELSGVFEVRERLDDPLLSIDPPGAAAGSSNLELELNVEGGVFSAQNNHVIFGDGSHVAIEEQVVESATEMTILVDIAGNAPIGTIEVAVTSGMQVARGEFEIQEKIYPTIQVDPDQIVRPASGESAVQASLSVIGSGTHFQQASEVDTDTSGGGGTIVEFPANPGVEVTAVFVESATQLSVNIMVDEWAVLGPTPLSVTTGDEVVQTDFTVLAALASPVMTVSPESLPRGCESALLIAQAVNFAFVNPLNVEIAENGCQVEGWEVLQSSESPNAMAIEISVDSCFEGSSVVLEVTSGGEAVAAHIGIEEPEGPTLAAPDPVSIPQGYDGYAVLVFQSAGQFSENAEVEVLPRSGVKIVYQSPAIDGSSLTLQLRVANDAPVGPALLRVLDGDLELETFVEIVPSGDVPWCDVSPGVVMAGRRGVVLSFESSGLALDAGVEVGFDDPALDLRDASVPGQGECELVVDVGLTARTDMIVTYLETSAGRAAATLRGLPRTGGVFSLSPSQVSRQDDPNPVLLVDAEGAELEGAVAQLPPEVGVDIERVTVLSDSTAELELSLEPEGPGGWMGVVLKVGSEWLVAPLEVAGDDETLTLELSPGEVPPGSRGAEIAIEIPAGIPAASLDPVLSTARAGVPGADAMLLEAISDSEALVALDVAHEIDPPAAGIPLLVTASRGALVGLVQVEPLASSSLTADQPWSGYLEEGELQLLSADPGDPPAIVRARADDADYAKTAIELLAEDGIVAEERVEGGRLWLEDGSLALLAVSPAGNPSGDPCRAELFSLGSAATGLVEPDDDPAEALEIGDPCAAPLLARGAIDAALDVDRVAIGETSCRVAAIVTARGAMDRPWAVPDARLELRDDADDVLQASDGWPSPADDDPRLFFDGDPSGRQIAVLGQLGSAGGYLLNVRRASVIGELCRSALGSFVEIWLEPGTSTDDVSLELVDGSSGLVLESLSLAGETLDNDGTIVIGGVLSGEADLVDPVGDLPDSGSFAVRLLRAGEVVDAVQLGGDGEHGEGQAVDDDGSPCFSRVGGIDTDDNVADFLGGWTPTPGAE
ncbi:MAG: hypothetical protein R6V85_00960 [Polyangia bacterium]